MVGPSVRASIDGTKKNDENGLSEFLLGVFEKGSYGKLIQDITIMLRKSMKKVKE